MDERAPKELLTNAKLLFLQLDAVTNVESELNFDQTLVNSYAVIWREYSDWLHRFYKRWQKPTRLLDRMLSLLDLRGCHPKQIAERIRKAEPIVARVHNHVYEIAYREFRYGTVAPGDTVTRVDVPSEFPKDNNRAEVLIDGNPHPVTYPIWELLKAMQDARPRSLTKRQVEVVNINGLKMLRKLRKQTIWEMVISMSGQDRSGYRLS